ncbi:hypothetical protein [uncultured Paludibaculum sp.]|uniref:hypothetical protein n=1 Tax=uncultured Paludibaculum sp. TaxID=1765020 RepID=UPI002AABAD2F|nr:hypothetical protein [uncultured Paludibaculum sp.]
MCDIHRTVLALMVCSSLRASFQSSAPLAQLSSTAGNHPSANGRANAKPTRIADSTADILRTHASVSPGQLPPEGSATTTQQSESETLIQPAVVQSNGRMSTQTWCELNGSVTIAITGLKDWATANNPNDLRIFLAGRVLPQSEPMLISISQGYVNFQLRLDPVDRDNWVQVLTAARDAKKNRIPISVGLKDSKQPFESMAYITLNVFPSYTLGVVSLLGFLLLGLIVLANRTALLRDGTRTSPFSLARLQMACWFYLVIAAYLYIWLITGGYNNLTSSALSLIGISGATGIAAIGVDKQKKSQAATERLKLEAQKSALTRRLTDLRMYESAVDTSLGQEFQQRKIRLFELEADIAALPMAPPPATSVSFLQDITADGNGIGFHRFQMLIWTVVFSIIFAKSVYADLAMPTFDASLLALMGVSSGTYLGFKLPETPKQARGTS